MRCALVVTIAELYILSENKSFRDSCLDCFLSYVFALILFAIVYFGLVFDCMQVWTGVQSDSRPTSSASSRKIDSICSSVIADNFFFRVVFLNFFSAPEQSKTPYFISLGLACSASIMNAGLLIHRVL